MITRIIAYILIAVAAGGYMWIQRAENKRLTLAVTIAKGNTDALTAARKDDAKRINAVTAEVSRQRAARDKIAKQLEENANETRDFFAMPIPDGVRRALNEYLAQHKAPDNRK